MERNIIELTLTSFNSVQLNLTEFTAVNNLVAMVTVEQKNTNAQYSKAYLINLKLNNFKTIEAVGLKVIASRSRRMTLPPYQMS
jgi:hypothetical protein